MYNNLAHNAYAQNNIGVESPQKLIEMLYEGVLRFNVQAKRSIAEGDIEKRTYWINRSVAIFAELLNTLDLSQGDVAVYLSGLYTRQIQLLSECSLNDEVEKIDEVNGVVKGLLEAWREVNDVVDPI